MHPHILTDEDVEEDVFDEGDWPGEEVTVTNGWRNSPLLFKRPAVGDVFSAGTMEMSPGWFSQGNTVRSVVLCASFAQVLMDVRARRACCTYHTRCRSTKRPGRFDGSLPWRRRIICSTPFSPLYIRNFTRPAPPHGTSCADLRSMRGTMPMPEHGPRA